jgi:hypothetical protein
MKQKKEQLNSQNKNNFRNVYFHYFKETQIIIRNKSSDVLYNFNMDIEHA